MNYYNYFTEIEEHFVRRRGKHLYISPMDWHLIQTWKDSGVPLHVALRGIDIAMDSYLAREHRRGALINSLAYCHQGVMEEYARYVESRVGEEQSAPADSTPEKETAPAAMAAEQPDKAAAVRWLNQRILEIETFLGKQSCQGETDGLRRIVQRMEEIVRDCEECEVPDFESLERDLGLVDQLLMDELKPLVPGEQTLQWEEEIKRELKVYRKRLPKDTYQKIRESFLRRKIHDLFQLGELSTFDI